MFYFANKNRNEINVDFKRNIGVPSQHTMSNTILIYEKKKKKKNNQSTQRITKLGLFRSFLFAASKSAITKKEATAMEPAHQSTSLLVGQSMHKSALIESFAHFLGNANRPACPSNLFPPCSFHCRLPGLALTAYISFNVFRGEIHVIYWQ